MRTDPRDACANTKEKWIWAFIHDLIAHPLMALTNWAKLSLSFHDWTSYRAWPRADGPKPLRYSHFYPGAGSLIMADEISPNIWRIKHPKVDHVLVVNAPTGTAALLKAADWFVILSDEFGGKFKFEVYHEYR